jgi:hypothetical protein
LISPSASGKDIFVITWNKLGLYLGLTWNKLERKPIWKLEAGGLKLDSRSRICSIKESYVYKTLILVFTRVKRVL